MASKIYWELVFDYNVEKEELNKYITMWLMQDLHKDFIVNSYEYDIAYDTLYKFMEMYEMFDEVAKEYEDLLKEQFNY